MKTNDQRIAGQLTVSLYAHPTDHLDRNDPSTAKGATVTGLPEAREWLEANGGYAKIQADFDGPHIAQWSVYRLLRGYGHRCVGVITPT